MLVGKQAEIEAALAKKKALEHPQITIRHASEVVEMDEPPAQALRNKKDSSIRVCANLVKDGLASAFVSAGNTGALMAISRFVLKTLDSIDRPAIASALPNMKGKGTLMLDLGANVDCEPAHLFQFAVMGSAFVKGTEGIEKPTVGLLNIGEEVIKGNDVVKKGLGIVARQRIELLRQRRRKRHLQRHHRRSGVRRFCGQCGPEKTSEVWHKCWAI